MYLTLWFRTNQPRIAQGQGSGQLEGPRNSTRNQRVAGISAQLQLLLTVVVDELNVCQPWSELNHSETSFRRLRSTTSRACILRYAERPCTTIDVDCHLQAKNVVLNVSEMEAKVRDATNDDPW